MYENSLEFCCWFLIGALPILAVVLYGPFKGSYFSPAVKNVLSWTESDAMQERISIGDMEEQSHTWLCRPETHDAWVLNNGSVSLCTLHLS